jgi:diaminopimelate decarboxylase
MTTTLTDTADWQALVTESVERFGTPQYLYRTADIEARIASLHDLLPGFALRFAVKANPNPWLLAWLRGRIDSLDVSSVGEIALATACGWQAERLVFTGPAKTSAELAAALDAGIGRIVVESIDEAQLLDALAGRRGIRQAVSLRISPEQAGEGFAVRLAGRPTQFGIDEEHLPAAIDALRSLSSLCVDGLHVYAASQCLDGDHLAAHLRATADVFVRALGRMGRPVSELVFGAGMGIPYHEGDASLDLAAVAPGAVDAVTRLRAAGRVEDTRTVLELGRYLVGEAGVYVTRVVRVKETRGSRIALCDGGMNHNLGACGLLGGTAHRHYRMRIVGRDEPAADPCRVVGPLCTTVDTLAHRVRLPAVGAGDLLVIGCGGAYGPTASPVYFISHAGPTEVMVTEDSGTPVFRDVSWLPSAGDIDVAALLGRNESTT